MTDFIAEGDDEGDRVTVDGLIHCTHGRRFLHDSKHRLSTSTSADDMRRAFKCEMTDTAASRCAGMTVPILIKGADERRSFPLISVQARVLAAMRTGGIGM